MTKKNPIWDDPGTSKQHFDASLSVNHDDNVLHQLTSSSNTHSQSPGPDKTSADTHSRFSEAGVGSTDPSFFLSERQIRQRTKSPEKPVAPPQPAKSTGGVRAKKISQKQPELRKSPPELGKSRILEIEKKAMAATESQRKYSLEAKEALLEAMRKSVSSWRKMSPQAKRNNFSRLPPAVFDFRPGILFVSGERFFCDDIQIGWINSISSAFHLTKHNNEGIFMEDNNEDMAAKASEILGSQASPDVPAFISTEHRWVNGQDLLYRYDKKRDIMAVGLARGEILSVYRAIIPAEKTKFWLKLESQSGRNGDQPEDLKKRKEENRKAASKSSD